MRGTTRFDVSDPLASIDANATQSAIFKASLNLARRLEMKALAEGAEDRADWDFAVEAGCDLLRGYFVAGPMEPESFAGWARQWRERFTTEPLPQPR